MAKKFKITEVQRDVLLLEGVTIQGETDSVGKADTSKTAQAISNSGIDPKKVDVKFNGAAMTGGNSDGQTTPMREHRIITKKQLQANRLRYLKENSEVLSLNNFMKKLH